MEFFCKEVAVKLSLNSFFDGRGILRTLTAKHVRGYADFRGGLQQAIGTSAAEKEQCTRALDSAKAANWREAAFDLDGCRIEDLEITVLAPDYEAPLKLSIYRASLDRVRQRWLLFDLLTAKYLDGAIDGALFSSRRLNDIKPPGDLRFGLPKSGDQYAVHDVRFDRLPLSLLAAKFPASSPLSTMLGGTADVRLSVEFPILHKYMSFDPAHSILYDQDVRINGRVDFRNVAAELPFSLPHMPSSERFRFTSVVHFLQLNFELLPLSFNVQTKLSAFAGARALSDAGVYSLLGHAAIDQIQRRIAEKSIAADSSPSLTSLYFGWGEFILRLIYGVLAG